MNLGRRRWLGLAAGAAAGTLFTPAPWKLIGDSALWSQNWSRIPKLPTGEFNVKYGVCTLCPAGCGIKARCAGDQVFGLTGVPGHPISRGKLCPLGVGAHQLPYHPHRFAGSVARQADGRYLPAELERVAATLRARIASRKSGEAVAVLDERPGRAISYQYRRFTGGLEDGLYLVPPAGEGATLAALSAQSERGASFGFRIGEARAAVSFGAPLLDGWGVPAEVNEARYRSQRPLRIIQAETRQSPTASLADVWLPIRPASETALALAIAHVLIRDGRAPAAVIERMSDGAEYRELVMRYSPEQASRECNIPAAAIEQAARMLADNTPAVAIGGGDAGGGPAGAGAETAIASLNMLLGAMGTVIVGKHELPVPDSWSSPPLSPERRIDSDVPDGSISMLILGDSPSGDALPWPLIERKLAPDHVIVSLSPYAETAARRAHFVIPAPAFMESFEESPGSAVSANPSWAIAQPLVRAPSLAVHPLTFLARLGAAESSIEDLLRQRLEELHKLGKGEIFTPAGTRPIGEFKDAKELWTAMTGGGVWTDSPVLEAARPRRFGVREIASAPARTGRAEFPIMLLPYARRGEAGTTALPPLMSKVYQESRLRLSAPLLRVHPATAAASGVADGASVRVEMRGEGYAGNIAVDASVMPGVIEAPAGPMAALCVNEDCSWRVSPARIKRIS